jgi:L-asparaginase
MKTIYLLTTGGTIEKVYSEGTGSVMNAESKIDRYLELLRLPDAEINIVPLMNKDSLEMTDEDRLLLLGMVRAILKEKSTHGYHPRHGHYGRNRSVSEASLARSPSPGRVDRSDDPAGL